MGFDKFLRSIFLGMDYYQKFYNLVAPIVQELGMEKIKEELPRWLRGDGLAIFANKKIAIKIQWFDRARDEPAAGYVEITRSFGTPYERWSNIGTHIIEEDFKNSENINNKIATLKKEICRVANK